MAKRRKKRSSGRRRRMGAMALNANNPVVTLGSVAAGYLMAATPVNSALDKVTGGKIDAKILGAAQVGLGALVIMKKGGKKSLPLTIGAGVLAGAGLKRLLVAMGVVSGFQSVPVIGGYRSVPVIGNGNGYRVPAGLGGYTTSPVKVMGKCGSNQNESNDHYFDDL